MVWIFEFGQRFVERGLDWNFIEVLVKMIKSFFIGFWEGQKLFGETIAIVINTVLLSVVYVIGVGLTSIAAKLFGKHFLDLKLDDKMKTYWIDLNLGGASVNDYYRQF